MKKTVILTALAICVAAGMNAEERVYDFDTAPSFFPYLQMPVEEGGMGQSGNYDFIDKTGMVKVDGSNGELLMQKNEEGVWETTPVRLRVSLGDGLCYTQREDGSYTYLDTDSGEHFPMDYSEPFIGYDEGGPCRVVWLYGVKSLTYSDDNYNAVDEASFVETARGLQFCRNDNSASRKATYIEFPAMQGPFTLTYYFCATSDSNRNKEQALRCKIVPVVDGVPAEELADVTNEPYGTVPDKRYVKKQYAYTGSGSASVRFYADGAQAVLMHALMTSGIDAALEDVIADTNDDAPVYNVMGQRVGNDYKGLVIKNGVKYVQK